VVGEGVALAGADASVNSCTPPWPRHAPLRFLPLKLVPSLQVAVTGLWVCAMTDAQSPVPKARVKRKAFTLFNLQLRADRYDGSFLVRHRIWIAITSASPRGSQRFHDACLTTHLRAFHASNAILSTVSQIITDLVTKVLRSRTNLAGLCAARNGPAGHRPMLNSGASHPVHAVEAKGTTQYRSPREAGSPHCHGRRNRAAEWPFVSGSTVPSALRLKEPGKNGAIRFRPCIVWAVPRNS